MTDPESAPREITRREFHKLALAAAAMPAVAKEKKPLATWAPGIKIALQVSPDPTDDDLTFAQQLGLDYITFYSNPLESTVEDYLRYKAKAEAAGLKIWGIGNTSVHCMPQVTLNLPGRDEKIEQYKQYLRNLGQAGIYYESYCHMANFNWGIAEGTTRGGAHTKLVDVNHLTRKEPFSNGRRYSKEEIWENYTYFIKQIVPVAEEEGIRIGIHPDDPPVPELAGVPRCIFGNFEGYVRALEIANSPNIGVCLCCGTWLEGGPLMGKEVTEAARYFAKQDKLFEIHFRNVSSPLPRFVETFIDNGYYDMYKIMQTLRDIDFRGLLIPDHFPAMLGNLNIGAAYSIAYIKEMRDRAWAEVKS